MSNIELDDKIWIGDKKIKNVVDTGEKTPAGTPLFEVEFVNNTKEIFSKIMYEAIISKESCDASALREKRVYPVVGSVLAIMREWGIKIGETQYFSVLVTQSLNNNKDEAEKQLWLPWGPTIKSLDDVDLIMVDRVLRSIKNDNAVVSPPEFYKKDGEEDNKKTE